MSAPAEDHALDLRVVVEESAPLEGRDEVLRLAAVRAAIDPERRYVRADILVSAIVEALAGGPLTEAQLSAQISRSWATRAVSESMLRRGLEVARNSYLVLPQVTLSGDDTWTLAEGVKEEAQRDGQWAEAVLAEFEQTLGRRLEEYTGVAESPEALNRLARHLFSGLVDAVEGTYQTAADSAAPGQLKPLRIDGRAVMRYMRRARVYEGVSPRRRQARGQALELAVAAVLDATDPFGNELLRLLTIGNILQGLLSARDVAAQRVAEGTRTLFDTSTIILLAEEGSPGRRLFDELVRQSSAAGVEMVVALHTLEEYEGLWMAADAELEGRTGAELDQLGASLVLVDNPFVREFLRVRTETDPSLTWQRFQIGRRNVRQYLEKIGFTVCWHGNEAERCRQLASDVAGRLRKYSDNPHTDANRSAQGARADAESSAMVARWRRERPATPPSAWFVARDGLTGRAYASVTSDQYPLTVSPESWLLYLSNLGNGDGATERSLAVTLGDVTARQQFLSVAAAYTTADVLRFASLLSEEGHGLSQQDLRKAVQLDLLRMLKEPEQERRGTKDVRDLADRVMRDRSQRRDLRASRATAEAQQHERELDALVTAEREAAQAEERLKADARVSKVEERLRREADERASCRAEEVKKKERAAAAEALRLQQDRHARERRSWIAALLFVVPTAYALSRWFSFARWEQVLAVCAIVLWTGLLLRYWQGKVQNLAWLIWGAVLVFATAGFDLAAAQLWGR